MVLSALCQLGPLGVLHLTYMACAIQRSLFEHVGRTWTALRSRIADRMMLKHTPINPEGNVVRPLQTRL